MAGFKFKMQRILDFKKTAEDEAASRYSEALAKVSREKDMLKALKNRLKQVFEERNMSSQSTNVVWLQMYNSYTKELEKKIEYQQEMVEKAIKEAEKVKQELIDASKEKKMFEKIKEKHLLDFREEMKKEEEKLNDQIVSYKNSNR